MAQISPARAAAFAILMAVERGEAHSDELLRGPGVTRLSALDRNLATALVMGVLRWQRVLDEHVRPVLRRPEGGLDAEVLIALRLGAFQLLHMDRIPAHAAIGESVELAQRAGHKFASGMVNAVLRKLARGAAQQGGLPEGKGGEVSTERCSPAAAYPAWMVDRWRSLFGEDTARAICRYGQSQPVLTVRIDDPRMEAELAGDGIELAPAGLLTAARLVIAGDVTATAVFREGRVRVQDEGSQLVAEIAGKGSAILDCCAAPGGKTLILAGRNPRASIVACDASPSRVEILRKRLAPAGLRVECRVTDATALGDEAAFDLVLADVPCSGTGTLGRNPEIRHRLLPEDFEHQAERQRAILGSALRAARDGGCVVYATCSLEPEENEQVVAAVLSESPRAHVLPIGERIRELQSEDILTPEGAEKLRQCITPRGYLRLLPGAVGTDGFFVALLEKTGDPVS